MSKYIERLREIDQHIWRGGNGAPSTVEDVREAQRQINEMFPSVNPEEQGEAMGLLCKLERVAHIKANRHVLDAWMEDIQAKRYKKIPCKPR